MKLVSVCTCTSLTDDGYPSDVKSVFTELDETVVIWAKLAEVRQDTSVKMDWFAPNKQRLLSVNIDVEACTDQRPFRCVWSFMKIPLARQVEHGFGVWEVFLQPFNDACRFRLADISNGYGSKGSRPEAAIILDKVY